MGQLCRHNLFQMYAENGWKAGFWIMRDTWANVIAEVLSVDGKPAGELDGQPPYFRNPEVRGNVYKLNSGELIDPNTKISCPGNYSYRRVEKPNWEPSPKKPAEEITSYGGFSLGETLISPKFGPGTLLGIAGEDIATIFTIHFERFGVKRIFVAFGNLQHA